MGLWWSVWLVAADQSCTVYLSVLIPCVSTGAVEVSNVFITQPSPPPQQDRLSLSVCVVVLCLCLFLSLNTLMTAPLKAHTHTHKQPYCGSPLSEVQLKKDHFLPPTVQLVSALALSVHACVCSPACACMFTAPQQPQSYVIPPAAPSVASLWLCAVVQFSVNMWVNALNLPGYLSGGAEL